MNININLPFFSYGFFRPGEISFLGINNFVCSARPLRIQGDLVLRDGITLFKESTAEAVDGYLITFYQSQEKDAYSFIDSLEPKKLFKWKEKEYGGIKFNILYGIKPEKGTDDIRESGWNTIWEDPFFSSAIDVLHEFKVGQFSWDLKPLFQLQMKYMLLWTIIERFSFLMYSLGAGPSERNKKLSENRYFKDALLKFVKKEREIYSADNPEERFLLDPQNSKKSIEYYYKVRCNISHRGKAVIRDFDTVRDSFSELFCIIEYVINKTKEECDKLKLKYTNN